MELFQHPDVFTSRHIGPSNSDISVMLQTVKASSLQELIEQTIPEKIRLKDSLHLPEAVSEFEFLKELKAIAAQNKVCKSYIGMGYYDCIVPSVILRNILENPGWYTQYTPYQAEISQGRLEALLNFQTMVIDLTGMEIANASLLDEATAAAEAMTMSYGIIQSKGKTANRFFVSENCHPQTIAVLKTRSEPLGIELVIGSEVEIKINDSFFGAILQYPCSDGSLRDYRIFVQEIHSAGGLVVVATDLLALSILTPPGEWGADIVVGSAQRFGVPMGYGGPHAAFFATKDEFKRMLPGRLIGVSIDSSGKPALRMALQTREQHIRREKATSNICTAQVLLAILSSMYAVYHGPNGIQKIAQRVHNLTRVLALALEQMGYYQFNELYFDTVRFYPGDNAGIKLRSIQSDAELAGINFRYCEDETIAISLDETTSVYDVQDIIKVLLPYSPRKTLFVDALKLQTQVSGSDLPEFFIRKSAFLTHPVFNRYHSETEMLRYIKRLESKDLSLCQSMIPLGSCTMKLNATTEMLPVTWREFGGLHPFAPLHQAKGYQKIFSDLERWLCQI
ncbi:MAG: glycine dehydrogenase (aminomethyl-transferring), partial [Bacteroidia bacterium]|nr:glycine dehydrogenase (aminomethyl-transferring) [Bacteroidia bacterium]